GRVPCGRVPCGRVPCGRSGTVPWLDPRGPHAPGSRCGAEAVRKSAKDEVPVAMHAAVNRSPKESKPTEILPVGERWSLPRPYCPAAARARRPAGNISPAGRSLPTLLDVGPDELLGVLLQDLVDLVQDRVHVVGQLLLALLDLLARLRVAFLGLLAAPGSLPLAAGVLCRHAETSSSGSSPPPRH